MAWLIVLALFLWIGGSICKVADKANCQRGNRIVQMQTDRYEFVANLYILGWNDYQSKENKLMDVALCAGPQVPHHKWEDIENYSQQVFGEGIFHSSCRAALSLMKSKGLPMFSHNEDYHESDIIKELSPVAFSNTFDTDKEATCWVREMERDFHCLLPPFSDFFHFYLADQTEVPWICKLIPDETDPRVPYYVFDNSRWTRKGLPTGFLETIAKKQKLQQAVERTRLIQELKDTLERILVTKQL